MDAAQRKELKQKALMGAVEFAKELVTAPTLYYGVEESPRFQIDRGVFAYPLNASANVLLAAIQAWCEALDVTISPLDIVEIVKSEGYEK